MSSEKRPICGDKTTRSFAAAVEHFRFIDWQQRKFVIGNFRTFGWGEALQEIRALRTKLKLVHYWDHVETERFDILMCVLQHANLVLLSCW